MFIVLITPGLYISQLYANCDLTVYDDVYNMTMITVIDNTFLEIKGHPKKNVHTRWGEEMAN